MPTTSCFSVMLLDNCNGLITTVAFQEICYNSEIEAFVRFLLKSRMSPNSVEWDDGQEF